ncbi:hypothetical protein HPP92_007426 [Vanilla planifolia]|uniref:C2H2-type domain-containing protein n=1 Tax=Vanilla planifolia TaxID=51239 RepID=A0A835RAF4_VANPL|nr:hypothetical protein HPP92_007426 [Vanilla planifolia]
MRAHGINDDSAPDPEDETSGEGGGVDWDGTLSPTAGSKRMYALRTNPNRLQSFRVCENCGKEFLSWKSFLDHGRCSSDDDLDDFPSPPCTPLSEDYYDYPNASSLAWSRGKRTRRTNPAQAACPSTEEEDLAKCLVMLSATRVDPILVAETEESCASANREERQRTTSHPTAAATSASGPKHAPAPMPSLSLTPPAPKGTFECKACKKVFTSHQALGGHRASHKKVKGCFAAKLDDPNDLPSEDDGIAQNIPSITIDTNPNEIGSSLTAMAIVPFDNPQPLASAPISIKNTSKLHECSVCHRQFASGQALGGHKRCHWLTSSSTAEQATSMVPKLHGMPEVGSNTLDLNLPAPVDGVAGLRQRSIVPLRLDVPATIFIQPPWIEHTNGRGSGNNNNTDTKTINIKNADNNDSSVTNVDDDTESKARLVKLGDLKGIKMGEQSSPWLQVGIGSSGKEDSSDS